MVWPRRSSSPAHDCSSVSFPSMSLSAETRYPSDSYQPVRPEHGYPCPSYQRRPATPAPAPTLSRRMPRSSSLDRGFAPVPRPVSRGIPSHHREASRPGPISHQRWPPSHELGRQHPGDVFTAGYVPSDLINALPPPRPNSLLGTTRRNSFTQASRPTPSDLQPPRRSRSVSPAPSRARSPSTFSHKTYGTGKPGAVEGKGVRFRDFDYIRPISPNGGSIRLGLYQTRTSIYGQFDYIKYKDRSPVEAKESASEHGPLFGQAGSLARVAKSTPSSAYHDLAAGRRKGSWISEQVMQDSMPDDWLAAQQIRQKHLNGSRASLMQGAGLINEGDPTSSRRYNERSGLQHKNFPIPIMTTYPSLRISQGNHSSLQNFPTSLAGSGRPPLQRHRTTSLSSSLNRRNTVATSAPSDYYCHKPMLPDGRALMQRNQPSILSTPYFRYER